MMFSKKMKPLFPQLNQRARFQEKQREILTEAQADLKAEASRWAEGMDLREVVQLQLLKVKNLETTRSTRGLTEQ
jgi:hypothetical protein